MIDPRLVLSLGVAASLLAASTVSADIANATVTSPTEAAAPDSTRAKPVLLPPIVLTPDSTGTRYVAPVQEVRGDRPDAQRTQDRLPHSAQILESDDWAHRGLSAPEVLAEATGLSLQSTGGLGASAQVSLRGSSAAQVPVFLDGLPLNHLDGGGADVGSLDLGAIERIEVYRGAAPLVLGGASLGGAIHLQSAQSRTPVLLSMTRRSHGGWIAETAASHGMGNWTLGGRLRLLRSDDDWEYFDDRGTLYNQNDDARRARANNDVRGGGGLLTATRPWADGTLRISTMVDAREQGLPGYSVLASENARGEAINTQSQVGWTSRPLARTRLREANVFGRLDRQRYIDLDGDFRRIAHDRRDDVVTLGGNVSGALRPQEERLWRTELLWSRIESQDRALRDGDGLPQSRWTAAAAIEPNLRFRDDRLLIRPGVRAERHFQQLHGTNAQGGLPTGTQDDITTDSFTAQVGIRWSLATHLALRANLGAYERIPTLLELFGDRGAVMGNPRLASEHGINRDLGVVFHDSARGTRLTMTVFDNDAFDLISLVQNSPVSVRYQNVGRAQIVGTEFEATFERSRRWRWTSSITRLLTRDRSERSYARGAPLPGRPGLTLASRAELHTGRLSTSLSVSALGKNYAQTGARAPIPSRTLWGLGARVRLGHSLALLGQVHNITDREVFDLYGYPLPGRQFSLTLQAGFPDAH